MLDLISLDNEGALSIEDMEALEAVKETLAYLELYPDSL